MTAERTVAACSCCGLVQWLPPGLPKDGALRRATGRASARCARCHTPLQHGVRSNQVTAALALSALVLFPLAISLPFLRVERYGHHSQASVWSGGVDLLADGQFLVGGVVVLCSIVLPLLKLITLFMLAGGGPGLGSRLRARAWRLVEWTGRWGMLDVLLVAILVAALKLGDMVDLTAGPGAWAFTMCVMLNLAASASFDPHGLWEEEA